MGSDPRSSGPGERRLERPPSDRYHAEEGTDGPRPASPARGLAYAAVVAMAGAAAVTLAGGIVTITAGLLVIAAVIGWSVAVAIVIGGGEAIDRRRRAPIAVAVALVSVALGQVGLWVLARGEGGVLPLVDYLAETFGVLVPLELVVAGVTAWLRAR